MPTLHAITRFTLITADLERLAQFYCDTLGFAVEAQQTAISSRDMAELDLIGGGRRLELSLGRQRVAIEQFESPGRPYPTGGNAASLWFQHLALVVSDMAAAYARLRDAKAISQNGPQTLPVSSGGVLAYKFRDPDGHPLELLQYSLRDTPTAWRLLAAQPGQIGVGIDHSAISVADADASAAFYQALGLSIGARSLNRGPAQQRLDDLPYVEVAVVPMGPQVAPPHLELLGYLTPRGVAGAALQPNDIAATRLTWRGDGAGLFRDLDGHLHQVEPAEPAA